MENQDTGILLNKHNIEIHRKYFKEMTRLIGINVLYRSPRPDKHYDGYGELDTFYNPPKVVGCIFDEHPTQWTMKKMGWNSELQEGLSVIHLPYDLEGLQSGAIVIVPSGLDNAEGRVFRVIRMSTIQVYPASIACEIGPVFESDFERSQFNHSQDNFNLLVDEEEN